MNKSESTEQRVLQQIARMCSNHYGIEHTYMNKESAAYLCPTQAQNEVIQLFRLGLKYNDLNLFSSFTVEIIGRKEYALGEDSQSYTSYVYPKDINKLKDFLDKIVLTLRWAKSEFKRKFTWYEDTKRQLNLF